MLRTVEAADAWLAEILACKKFGIASAAMIRMMATTIISAISETPVAGDCGSCSPGFVRLNIVSIRVTQEFQTRSGERRTDTSPLSQPSNIGPYCRTAAAPRPAQVPAPVPIPEPVVL